MRLRNLLAVVPSLAAATIIPTSCNDDVSTTGSSLITGEVTIYVDSLEMSIPARSVYSADYDARTQTKLLGRIRVPEYGELRCSFVSQLMSAVNMEMPDSITVADVDSMRMVMLVPRGALTGDSLAPQQLTVYRLTDPLPADITNTYDPTGHYDPTPLGKKSYSLSALSQAADSLFSTSAYIKLAVMMPRQFAIDVVNAYRTNPGIFSWPETFNKYFPGVYVEQNFGNGCIANIASMKFFTYWHRTERKFIQVDGKYDYHNVIVRDSTCLFASQPEVLSSNNISYTASDHIKSLVEAGNTIITTPGGYEVDFTFPAQEILDIYGRHQSEMSVISSLSLNIPALTIPNDYGIGVAPTLLLVKKSEKEEFFAKNKVPDSTTSFYATYDSSTRTYRFGALRSYLLNVLAAKGELTADDVDFCLVPVSLTTETVSNYGSDKVYVTACTPYLEKPTMTRLDFEHARVSFSFTRQTSF